MAKWAERVLYVPGKVCNKGHPLTVRASLLEFEETGMLNCPSAHLPVHFAIECLLFLERQIALIPKYIEKAHASLFLRAIDF